MVCVLLEARAGTCPEWSRVPPSMQGPGRSGRDEGLPDGSRAGATQVVVVPRKRCVDVGPAGGQCADGRVSPPVRRQTHRHAAEGGRSRDGGTAPLQEQRCQPLPPGGQSRRRGEGPVRAVVPGLPQRRRNGKDGAIARRQVLHLPADRHRRRHVRDRLRRRVRRHAGLRAARDHPGRDAQDHRLRSQHHAPLVSAAPPPAAGFPSRPSLTDNP